MVSATCRTSSKPEDKMKSTILALTCRSEKQNIRSTTVQRSALGWFRLSQGRRQHGLMICFVTVEPQARRDTEHLFRDRQSVPAGLSAAAAICARTANAAQDQHCDTAPSVLSRPSSFVRGPPGSARGFKLATPSGPRKAPNTHRGPRGA